MEIKPLHKIYEVSHSPRIVVYDNYATRQECELVSVC
jgi:hypothetical protein